MSSREGQSSGWPTEPEASSASGGHLARDGGSPLFDPLVDPLPSEREDDPDASGRSSEGRTRPLPGVPERTRASRRETQVRSSAARPRTGIRRVRRTIKRVDPWSVLKLSLFYYAIFLVFWLLFVAVIYNIIEGMGVFDALESFGQGFALEWGEIDISLMLVERWAFFIGVTLVILGSLINAFLAFLYNVGSDLVGGVEMTFTERDL